ncbi:MAG: short-chain fatty acid transporter [Phycisphaeraceae bacterium]|nr:short-chain fatty acid transporter [Phycisphaerales bacterium]MCB9861618.1 short-chain fatty acid transporter [Phycisphaeraceae bacterium]
MLATLGDRISRIFRAVVPDPFVIAVLLTLLVLGLAWWRVDANAPEGVGPFDSFVQVIGFWSDPSNGIWKFLGFGMQMCLILVTGFTLAESPPVNRLLTRLADVPRSGRSAVALVAVVSCSLSLINWGFGLIGGALFATFVGRAMSKRGIHAPMPILAAAAYMSLMVWHGGLSGTAPLKVTTPAQIADVLPEGVILEPIPLSRTILSPLNMVITFGLVAIAATVLFLLVHKDTIDPKQVAESSHAPRASHSRTPPSDSDRSILVKLLEDSPIINMCLAAMIGIWAWKFYVPDSGGIAQSGIMRLSPDEVNLTMLMLGLILHGTPRRFLSSVERAAGSCGGIILQFPLYAGIMGMMHASGLTAWIADGIASIGTRSTLPALTCVSAGVVNLFVPSGGGQWAVQGPIVVKSAVDAGADVPTMVMALSYGDQLTNMLQPFWALPLLAITGVRARDMVGYSAIVMVIAFVWVIGCLLVAGML